MSPRLEPTHRVVTWVETRNISVGYYDCAVCGIETPEPTMDRLIQFAQSNRGRFMWPSSDYHQPGCLPPGWGLECTEGTGLICPDCVAAKAAAFAARRKQP
jgi:hypothetical protein